LVKQRKTLRVLKPTACAARPPLYVFQMLSLTRREGKVLAFLLLAFVFGCGVKQWRATRDWSGEPLAAVGKK